ncbi:MAG: helix-turn-helix domain-containing protein [Oscillospiraceae bacterium]|jgi:transcriptional regulator with XRE-family HTH domain|nr:helix-turn-helix domain-containing protein [Oscillospiraceae bacterium]
MTFGKFIADRRKDLGMIYRDIAEPLGVSVVYVCDVEKGRRNAFEKEKLGILASLLGLTEEEKARMYDLAGEQRQEVSPDLPEYIMGNDHVRFALRAARDLGAGEAEWMGFVEELKRRNT